MLRVALVIVVVALSALAGCKSSGFERPGYVMGCPTGGDKKIKDKDDLIEAKVEKSGKVADIEVSDLRCSERGTLLRVDVDLMNQDREVRRIAWRFRWLDKEGMRAWEDESWKPVLIYGKTRHTLSTLAPSQEAVDFRLMLLDQDKP